METLPFGLCFICIWGSFEIWGIFFILFFHLVQVSGLSFSYLEKFMFCSNKYLPSEIIEFVDQEKLKEE